MDTDANENLLYVSALIFYLYNRLFKGYQYQLYLFKLSQYALRQRLVILSSMNMLHCITNIPRVHKRATEIIPHNRSPGTSLLSKKGALDIKHNICYYSMTMMAMSSIAALSCAKYNSAINDLEPFSELYWESGNLRNWINLIMSIFFF